MAELREVDARSPRQRSVGPQVAQLLRRVQGVREAEPAVSDRILRVLVLVIREGGDGVLEGIQVCHQRPRRVVHIMGQVSDQSAQAALTESLLFAQPFGVDHVADVTDRGQGDALIIVLEGAHDDVAEPNPAVLAQRLR